MKIKELELIAIGGIEAITLSFNERVNIICGPNGIGKSTILEAVALSFSHGAANALTKHYKHSSGRVSALLYDGEKSHVRTLEISRFDPSLDPDYYWEPVPDLTKHLLYSKTARTFDYIPLESIRRDDHKNGQAIWSDMKNGLPTEDIKNWFVHRFLYSMHPGSLTEEQVNNYNLAKKCFSTLNDQFSFSNVEGSSNDILVSTPTGIIYYEYLSSGFKSCISILFGIIKEIEYRFTNPRISAEEFAGTILIDELELHLHPEWQSRITSTIAEIFPNAQFIVTTHSPHIIQSAGRNEIIALEEAEGFTGVRELPTSAEGYKGWTIDEVLTDIMGMADTRSEYFQSLIEKFGKAIDQENIQIAEDLYEELDRALHPSNPSRKLLRVQLASIQGGDHGEA